MPLWTCFADPQQVPLWKLPFEAIQGQDEGTMATTTEFKSVLDLARLGLELGLSVQEAVDEANAQFQADIEELQRVIQQHKSWKPRRWSTTATGHSHHLSSSRSPLLTWRWRWTEAPP